MYMLIEQPNGDEARRAFDALDDAFGTDDFSKEDAMEVLSNRGFSGNMFNALLMSGSISEA